MLRLALGVLIAMASAASAQIPIGAPSIPVNANEQDFGVAGQPGDDCFLLDLDAAPTAGATSFDLRLVPCFGKPSGTEILDGDDTERAAAYPQANGAAAEGVRYADVNSDGRYEDGDSVYVTSAAGAGTGLVATTATGSWTIRLTATGPEHGSHPAGTLVFQGDADCMAYCSNAADFGAASIGWFDADGSTGYTPGDVAYLMPRAPGAPPGSLVPPYSIRLTASAQQASASDASSPASTTASGPPPSAPPSSTMGSTEPDMSGPAPTESGPDTPAVGPLALLVTLMAAALARKR